MRRVAARSECRSLAAFVAGGAGAVAGAGAGRAGATDDRAARRSRLERRSARRSYTLDSAPARRYEAHRRARGRRSPGAARTAIDVADGRRRGFAIDGNGDVRDRRRCTPARHSSVAVRRAHDARRQRSTCRSTRLTADRSSLPADTAVGAARIHRHAQAASRASSGSSMLTARSRATRFIEGPTTLDDGRRSTIPTRATGSARRPAARLRAHALIVGVRRRQRGATRSSTRRSRRCSTYLDNRTTDAARRRSATPGTDASRPRPRSGRAWLDYHRSARSPTSAGLGRTTPASTSRPTRR